eukprot:CAMPEP_0177795160 /NCGR_PEP_ID=MMETSP0491_2-20121128/26075_1 /TAXON_ID=63592 /ORGANISM="Tetraselmis chuii, Strain PLY429" /LENGTH=494 /DNA_ID=CAMNT_0019317953 /DNA_START=73 /DNA_END=1562 /DNA_ORIENTATION=-
MTQEWALPSSTEVRLIESSCEALSELEKGPVAECRAAGGICGLDAEWPPCVREQIEGQRLKPSRARRVKDDGEDRGIASLVQLALAWRADSATTTGSRELLMPVVALLDVTTLPLPALHAVLLRLVTDSAILKVGLSLKGDLVALNKAFVRGGLEPLEVATVAPTFDLARWRAFRGAGLVAIVERSLPGHTLGKAQQCSDWGSRPLSSEQVQYAATDPAVCVAVFDALCSAHSVSVETSSYPEAAIALNARNDQDAGVRDSMKIRNRRDPTEGDDSEARWSGTVPWPDGQQQPRRVSDARFVCDEAAEGLARGLRMCGIDTASVRTGCPPGIDAQQWVAELAERQARVVLTTDGKLFRRLLGYPAYLVRSGGKQNQIQEVSVNELSRWLIRSYQQASRLPPLPLVGGPFLPDSSGHLRLAIALHQVQRDVSAPSRDEAAVRASEVYARAPDREYWECTGCSQQYWQGGMYSRAVLATERLRATLKIADTDTSGR